MENPDIYQIVYDIIFDEDQDKRPDLNLELVESLRKTAEEVFGPANLDLGEIEKCYLEERIYETETKWVLVIDLYIPDVLKLVDIKADSLEAQSVGNMIPLSDLRAENKEKWDRIAEPL